MNEYLVSDCVLHVIGVSFIIELLMEVQYWSNTCILMLHVYTRKLAYLESSKKEMAYIDV